MYHERFERAFADYIGTQYAIAVPHCTAAIHLALEAAGIGPGDEVIVPELTWIATAAPAQPATSSAGPLSRTGVSMSNDVPAVAAVPSTMVDPVITRS